MTNDIQGLIKAIQKAHDCKAEHLASVPVLETFRGYVVWKGIVEEFSIHHPQTERCYGWIVPSDTEKDKTRYVTILGLPPIDSPLKAVQAFIAAEIRKDTPNGQ